MPKLCSIEGCKEPASVRVRHTGAVLCRQHFVASIEARAYATIEHYGMLGKQFDSEGKPRPEHWVIGMSGGKDSQALAEVLVRRYGPSNERVRFSGLYIDVGVSGNNYTDESREIVRRTCERLGIPCVIVDVKKEYGIDMDDVHIVAQCRKGAHRAECSACGVMKRYLINREAARMGGDRVATGHHLTDESTMLLSNFFNISVEQMARGQPWEKRTVLDAEGKETADGVLLPRVKPFLEITEEETTLYVRYAGVEHVATQCPYASKATSSALKKHMIALEMDRPGTMLRMVRGFHASFLPVLLPSQGAIQKAAIAARVPNSERKGKEAEATEETEDGETEGNDVPLRTCTKCGCLTIVPVCAWCKLVDQANEFKAAHPEFFDPASEKRHVCSICNPERNPSATTVAASVSIEDVVPEKGNADKGLVVGPTVVEIPQAQVRNSPSK